MSELEGVAERDHAYKSDEYFKIEWETISSDSHFIDNSYHVAYDDMSNFLWPSHVPLSVAK